MGSGKKEQEKNSQKYFYKMELKTKVGLLQLKIHKNKDLNIKKAVNKIRYAAKKGAKIVCTSELFLFEYFCKTENHSNFKYAEKMSPLGNATAEECAEYCIFLFSDMSKKITMQNLFHDGGFSYTGISEDIIHLLDK